MVRSRGSLVWMLVLGACGSSGTGRPGATDAAGDGDGDGPAPTDGAANDAARNPPGAPRLGAHVLAYHRLHAGVTPLTTPAIATAGSGSTIVVSIGRGALAATAAPTDSRGNSYAQLGTAHPYTNWSSSGTSLYAATAISGGAGHTISATTPADDEITLAAVEVVDGAAVHDAQWNEVLAPAPLRSRSVTTTGPATLVAFWWGDAGVEQDKTAVPDNGFVVVDSVLAAGALVQCAVAVREVADAGTYDVTWTATPTQGAQLWIVAVQ